MNHLGRLNGRSIPRGAALFGLKKASTGGIPRARVKRENPWQAAGIIQLICNKAIPGQSYPHWEDTIPLGSNPPI